MKLPVQPLAQVSLMLLQRFWSPGQPPAAQVKYVVISLKVPVALGQKATVPLLKPPLAVTDMPDEHAAGRAGVGGAGGADMLPCDPPRPATGV